MGPGVLSACDQPSALESREQTLSHVRDRYGHHDAAARQQRGPRLISDQVHMLLAGGDFLFGNIAVLDARFPCPVRGYFRASVPVRCSVLEPVS